MKKVVLVLLSFFSLFSFSQNINKYEFVIVPTMFDFQQTENQYRLSTVLKFRLEEYGYKTFYSSEQIEMNTMDRCDFLNANVTDESGLFVTKLFIEFKDCFNTVVFKSAVGSSRTKDRKTAYNEALEIALLSVKSLNYKFEGKSSEKIASVLNAELINAVQEEESIDENALFAQPIVNGYQLVDSSPKVVLRIFKCSLPDFYIANVNNKDGIVFKKNNKWIFEYYVDGKLISEKLNIKF
jgi:hypothetical protein